MKESHLGKFHINIQPRILRNFSMNIQPRFQLVGSLFFHVSVWLVEVVCDVVVDMESLEQHVPVVAQFERFNCMDTRPYLRMCIGYYLLWDR